MARPLRRWLVLALLLLLAAVGTARKLQQETHGIEPAELDALLNPQALAEEQQGTSDQGDGGEAGGGSSEGGGEPAPAVSFSKPAKKQNKQIAAARAWKSGKAGGTAGKNSAPVEVPAPPKKKQGKDMTAPELEWEKKAINASIAG